MARTRQTNPRGGMLVSELSEDSINKIINHRILLEKEKQTLKIKMDKVVHKDEAEERRLNNLIIRIKTKDNLNKVQRERATLEQDIIELAKEHRLNLEMKKIELELELGIITKEEKELRHEEILVAKKDYYLTEPLDIETLEDEISQLKDTINLSLPSVSIEQPVISELSQQSALALDIMSTGNIERFESNRTQFNPEMLDIIDVITRAIANVNSH